MVCANNTEILELLKKYRDTLFIVEGKKDKAALEEKGIMRIKTLNGPLYKIVEEVAAEEKEVVLLTDLDKKGKELYGRLCKDLTRRGVKVLNELREALLRAKISHIEGLDRCLESES